MSLAVALNREDLNEGTIIADANGMPIYAWSRDSTIVNRMDISFDFNRVGLVEGDFARRQVYVADASRDRYGMQQPVVLQCRGVDSLFGGVTLMDQLALTYFQRWAFAPPLLRLPVVYAAHTIEPGDRRPVTHRLIKNPITGKMGLKNELFEVINVAPSWLSEGRVDLLLLWVGAIETSATPTATLVNLKPGLSTLDLTDVPVGLAGSVTLTTAPGTTQLRIGLKRTTGRVWDCLLSTTRLALFKGGGCVDGGNVIVERSYTGSVTYHMDYKTTGAPGTPGTGGDPTTGYVPLLASKTLGSVSLLVDGGCGGGVSAPTESFFNEFFATLGASPNTYNVKVFYDAVGTQASPCGAIDPNMCSSGGCGGNSLISSTLKSDLQAFTVDYQESLT